MSCLPRLRREIPGIVGIDRPTHQVNPDLDDGAIPPCLLVTSTSGYPLAPKLHSFSQDNRPFADEPSFGITVVVRTFDVSQAFLETGRGDLPTEDHFLFPTLRPRASSSTSTYYVGDNTIRDTHEPDGRHALLDAPSPPALPRWPTTGHQHASK